MQNRNYTSASVQSQLRLVQDRAHNVNNITRELGCHSKKSGNVQTGDRDDAVSKKLETNTAFTSC